MNESDNDRVAASRSAPAAESSTSVPSQEGLEAWARATQRKWLIRTGVYAALTVTPLIFGMNILKQGWSTREVAGEEARRQSQAILTGTKEEIKDDVARDLATAGSPLRHALDEAVSDAVAAQAQPGASPATSPSQQPNQEAAPPNTVLANEVQALASSMKDLQERDAGQDASLAELRAAAASQAQATQTLSGRLEETRSQLAALRAEHDALLAAVEADRERLRRWRATIGETWQETIVTKVKSNPTPLPGTSLEAAPGETSVGSEKTLRGLLIREVGSGRLIFGSAAGPVEAGKTYSFQYQKCSYSLTARVLQPSNEVRNVVVLAFTRVCQP